MKVFLDRIRSFFVTTRRPGPVSDWFSVSFDAERVYLEAAPPGRTPWKQDFAWADVVRVCLKTEDLTLSDGLYIFTRTRPESYVIPAEARGGAEFFSALMNRGLFDAELAIRAATTSGKVFCWPPS